MFQQNSKGYHLDRQVAGRTQCLTRLIRHGNLKEKWHEIVVQARWSKGSCGFFRVWVNGARVVSYAGPTMEVDTVYFKYGLYRSHLCRYKKKRNRKDVPTQWVLYANVRRAMRRSDL